ncbi:MAG: SDR family oxidoreductase [Actinomycetota bacterium]|nr:SDR family oxidoreductase [Actinomycetota bacterium]
MDLGLAGKKALVGGASRGLGRAAALTLAREGCSVALYARTADELERAAEEIAAATGRQALAIPGDVGRAEDCDRIVSETVATLGGLDVLVTNTGPPDYGSATSRGDEDWQAAWERMTLGVIRLARAALPHLRLAGGGSIVNIFGCDLHQLVGHTASASVARLATTGFSKYLATELAPENIRVNNVLPGWIATERIEALVEAEADERGLSAEDVYEEQAGPVPMGRFGRPEEIADAIAFLASDRAAYITGTSLRVDGGWCLNVVY